MILPQEHVGEGSLSAVRTLVEGRSRVFVVHGAGSYSESGAEEHLSAELSRCERSAFGKLSSNPEAVEIEECVRHAREFNPEVIVGVGGGSALDVAKVTRCLLANGSPLTKLLDDPAQIAKRGVALILIPTTAGSGSEATQFSTVYVDGTKRSLDHPLLAAEHAIVDPRLTYSLSPRQTAISGLDALSQAIESYWSVRSSGESREYAREALLRLWPTIRPVFYSPTPALRRAMAEGALLAGRAINVTRTTGAHAISYVLTGKFGVPHGHAVALTVGKFFPVNAMEYGGELQPTVKRGEHEERMHELCRLIGCQTPHQCAEEIRKLTEEMGLETSFAKLGITDIGQVIQRLDLGRAANNPVVLTQELIRQGIFNG